jgi:hypothetical protein
MAAYKEAESDHLIKIIYLIHFSRTRHKHPGHPLLHPTEQRNAGLKAKLHNESKRQDT